MVWHLSLLFINSFNKTEAAALPAQAMLSMWFPFSQLYFLYCYQQLTPGFLYRSHVSYLSVFCVVLMSSSAVLTGQSSVSWSCRLQFWQACLLVVLMSLAVVLTCQSSVSPSCRLQFWQASLLCPAHVVVCSFDRPVLSELWQF